MSAISLSIQSVAASAETGIPTKFCRKCDKHYPVDRFTKRGQCRRCRYKAKSARNKRKTEEKRLRGEGQNPYVDSEHKRCGKCREVKHISKFGRNRSRKDGLKNRCKNCCKTANEKWRAENPEKKLACRRAYRSSPKGREAHRAKRNRRRARKRNAPGNATTEQIKARFDYHGNKCRYCGCSDKPLAIEHMIPLARGGSNWPSNLVPACTSCNSSKRAKTYKEFVGS